MANPEHLKILQRGVKAWNKLSPNLSYADLSHADLRDAKLNDAVLHGANLSGANLSGADFIGARLDRTTFANNDLSEVKGLETLRHEGPSSIGVDTFYKSAGKIPEAFLRGCGIPDDFITFIPSHFGVQQAIQFYSCFISYNRRDEEFARRLYSRMRYEKLRVWFAPEDMKGGQKLFEQIERAIQLHDRLLLVLSESSMQSEWVIAEIQRARETEIKEGRRKLFPITIVEFDKIEAWRRFDADTGKDLAKEVREYFIPDFSNWKEHDAFEKAFERLLRDLRDEEKRA
jgi:TIR domain/Pentapeptide repeats (8 copies)